MLDVGSSGDRTYIKALRQKFMTKPDATRQELSRAVYARLALAKLGETAAQQSLWCWSRGKAQEPDWSYGNVSTFSYIGGWSGSRGLDLLLVSEGEKAWSEWHAKQEPWDAPPVPPYTEALNSIAKLIPESPAGKDRDLAFKFMATDYARTMHKWIWNHEGELSKLEPTGEGVDFLAQACKDGKPVEKPADSK